MGEFIFISCLKARHQNRFWCSYGTTWDITSPTIREQREEIGSGFVTMLLNEEEIETPNPDLFDSFNFVKRQKFRGVEMQIRQRLKGAD
jgi:long-subunit fatty acid transport protein